MKKSILTIFYLLCITVVHAQQESHRCGAGSYNTFSLEVLSTEDIIMNGVSIFQVKLKAVDSTKIDTLYFIDTSGITCFVDTQFTNAWLLPGDSIYATLKVMYDVDSLPY